jgi:hypothetical protein
MSPSSDSQKKDENTPVSKATSPRKSSRWSLKQRGSDFIQQGMKKLGLHRSVSLTSVVTSAIRPAIDGHPSAAHSSPILFPSPGKNRSGASSHSSLFICDSDSDLDDFLDASDVDEMEKDAAKSPRGEQQPEPRGSPTFLRHKSLLNANPSAPPPISNFESFKLRSKLLKSHLSASAAEECVSELARFGTPHRKSHSKLTISIRKFSSGINPRSR